MAKAKKKEELTLEEKLERALVPVEEQPYQVPENWCWTRIREICEFERGITFPASAKEYELTEENIACLRTANIQEELELEDLLYVNKRYTKGNEAKLVKKDDIIMSSANSRELVGKVSYVYDVNEPMTFGGFVLNIRAKKILSKYLFYMLRFEFLSGRFMSESTQTTNIANINTTTLGNYCFPLSPLAEQQQIVEQIESLFAKLDEAKEKIQGVIANNKMYKQSILRKAFNGEFTNEWRKMNHISKNTWEEKTLSSVCKSIFDGDHMPPPKADIGVNFLVISNINTGYLSFENTRYVTQEYYDNLTETRKPEKGDVLYTLVGSYGIPVVVDSNHPFCFQRHIGLLKPNTIDTYYLWYQLQSQEFFDKATTIANGTAQLTVPIKGLRQLTIKCPTIEEQKEIVRVLDRTLEKYKQVKESAEFVIQQIDLMKKSILAKAFRGELGTNNPEEESAIELLKEIFEKS